MGLGILSGLMWAGTAIAQTPPSMMVEDRLGQLNETELIELARNREDFDSKTPEQKQQLRDFHTQLANHPDREKLERVMLQYHAWLATLDEQNRAKVLDLPPAERIAKINQIRRQQSIDWLGKIGPTQLPKEDAVPVYWWYEEMLKAKQELIYDVARQLVNQNIIDLQNELLTRELMRGQGYRRSALSMQRNVAERLLIAIQEQSPESLNDIFFPSDINSLMNYLSNEGRKIVEKSEPGERSRLVVRWITDAREIKSRDSISQRALENFYQAELTPETRDELDAMSSEGRRNTLIDLYTKWRRQKSPRFQQDPFPFPPDF
ncbi:MAG: hypothetical protein MK108_12675 [Mariniblastus sp.]|nr:hypothetical protein [Mariniblastus sp.]